MGKRNSYSWLDGSPLNCYKQPSKNYGMRKESNQFGISTAEMLEASESHLRAENSIRNMQIMMHPEKYENPAWQINVNNTGTASTIEMNRRVIESMFKRK